MKMVLSLYLSWESSDFDEIWCADSIFGSKNSHMLIYKKIAKFKVADSRHIEKSSVGYISMSYCPIDAVFGMYK